MFMLRFTVGLLAMLLCCSCSSTPANSHGRFHEEAETDVVLRFAGWNSIRITKPDTTEDGFMPVYNLDEAERVLGKPGIGRNLAVVVCGFGYGNEEEVKQQNAWATVLSRLGYHRVTFVR